VVMNSQAIDSGARLVRDRKDAIWGMCASPAAMAALCGAEVDASAVLVDGTGLLEQRGAGRGADHGDEDGLGGGWHCVSGQEVEDDWYTVGRSALNAG
jgi:hypothetical protein